MTTTTRGYGDEDLAEMFAAEYTRQGRPTTKTEALAMIFDVEDLSGVVPIFDMTDDDWRRTRPIWEMTHDEETP